MSLFDYKQSKEIEACGYSFYALIMATMRQADSLNLIKLKSAFLGTYLELQQRYNAPGGLLPDELDKEEYIDF